MKRFTTVISIFCMLGTFQTGLAMETSVSTQTKWQKAYEILAKAERERKALGTADNPILLKESFVRNLDSTLVIFGCELINEKQALSIEECRSLYAHAMTRDYSSAQEWRLLLRHREDWKQVQVIRDQYGIIHISYLCYRDRITAHILVDSDNKHYKAILEFDLKDLEPIIISGLVSEFGIEVSTAAQPSSSASATTATSSSSSSSAAATASATTEPTTASVSASCSDSSTLSQQARELFNRAIPALTALTAMAMTTMAYSSQAAKQ